MVVHRMLSCPNLSLERYANGHDLRVYLSFLLRMFGFGLLPDGRVSDETVLLSLALV